tara:strand:+ start:899 stop:2395 length:1497 start_codon:yes stop_codon:yes gene_type:complete
MKKAGLAGLDIGTSKIRCILFDTRGNILFKYSLKTPIIQKKDGIYNPTKKVLEIVFKILKKTFKFSKEKKLTIKGLSISSVGEAGIPIDKNNNALMDIIPWYDQRTKAIKQKLYKKDFDFKIYNTTGLNSDYFYSVYKILWIKKYKNNIYKKIHKWLPVNDFIAMKLTGNKSTDYSQAMRTLLFDPKRLCWSKEMIKLFGIKNNILPKIINAGDVKGNLNSYFQNKLGIEYNCIVAAGGHDHFVGIFGLGGFFKNTVVNSMGSAEAISLNTNKFIKNDKLRKGKFISGVFRTKEKTNYYIVGSILTSGTLIEWFIKTFKIKNYKKLKNLFNEKNNKEILFFPQFEYSHSPVNLESTKGFITGLDRSTSISDIYTSMLKCLSFDTKNALEFICSNTKNKINKIICSGGSVRNKHWMKTRADILNCDIYVDKNIENVSLGSAILAGLASKIYKNEEEAFKSINHKFKIIKTNKNYLKKYKYLHEKYNDSISKLYKLNNIT